MFFVFFLCCQFGHAKIRSGLLVEVKMEKIVLISAVPDNISGKAMRVLKSFGKSNRGWKKVSGLSNFISYRLSRNYRILMSINGLAFIGNHDDYSLKIKILKKEGSQ